MPSLTLIPTNKPLKGRPKTCVHLYSSQVKGLQTNHFVAQLIEALTAADSSADASSPGNDSSLTSFGEDFQLANQNNSSNVDYSSSSGHCSYDGWRDQDASLTANVDCEGNFLACPTHPG